MLQILVILHYTLTSQSLMAPIALPITRTKANTQANLVTIIGTALRSKVIPSPKIMLPALMTTHMALEHHARFVAKLDIRPWIVTIG